MTLRVYERPNTRSHPLANYPPFVSLPAAGRKGVITLSGKLAAQIGQSWHWCKLMYDDELNEILIKLVRDEDVKKGDKQAVAIGSPTKQPGRSMCLRSPGWDEALGLERPEQTTRFRAEYDQSKRMVVVHLDKPILPKSKRNGGAR